MTRGPVTKGGMGGWCQMAAGPIERRGVWSCSNSRGVGRIGAKTRFVMATACFDAPKKERGERVYFGKTKANGRVERCILRC